MVVYEVVCLRWMESRVAADQYSGFVGVCVCVLW